MSRYIDADAFVLYLENEIRLMEEDGANPYALMIAGGAIIDVNKQPTIDIVRCKECKWLRYCETEDLNMFLDCDHPDGGGIPRNENWFCADGEREGE